MLLLHHGLAVWITIISVASTSGLRAREVVLCSWVQVQKSLLLRLLLKMQKSCSSCWRKRPTANSCLLVQTLLFKLALQFSTMTKSTTIILLAAQWWHFKSWDGNTKNAVEEQFYNQYNQLHQKWRIKRNSFVSTTTAVPKDICLSMDYYFFNHTGRRRTKMHEGEITKKC